MGRRQGIAVLLVALTIGAGIALAWTPSGYTKIRLTQEGRKTPLCTAVLKDNEPLALTWRNSQFGLDVTEGFFAQGGILIQNRVTFAVPGGALPPRVSAAEVADLFHTGGPFDARGLSRPLSRVVYRIGEIGDPRLHLKGRTIAFKQEAGFGGRIILEASRPACYELLSSRP